MCLLVDLIERFRLKLKKNFTPKCVECFLICQIQKSKESNSTGVNIFQVYAPVMLIWSQ